MHTAAPGPRGHPLLGVFHELQRNPLQYLTEAARRYGDVVSLPLGIRRAYLLAHPDHIQHVLQDKAHLYRKSTRVTRIKPLFGEGLTTSEGTLWRRQRRLMQAVFQHQRTVALVPVICDATAAMLERWQSVAARREPLDLEAALRDLTLAISSRLLFGTDVTRDASVVAQALTTAVDYLNRSVWTGLAWPTWLPTSRHRQFRRALRTLDAYVYRRMTERCSPWSAGNDVLSLLLAARDDSTGKGMSFTQLRDEVLTLWIAGHTTVTAALAWTWYLLVQHPDAEQALHEELATVLGGRPPTAQDLSALTYTRRIIAESLRLYPPTWATARTPLTDDTIGGYRIRSPSVVLLSPYVLHRHPAFWDHPERFDPYRFTPERSAARPRFAYFPFGGGPRGCVGQHLAIMEMMVILAMVAQAYQLRLVPGHAVEPQPVLTLRPRQGVVMTLCQQACLPRSGVDHLHQ